jgi:hypothetical protein
VGLDARRAVPRAEIPQRDGRLHSDAVEGRAFYRATGEGRYRGFWIDNSGALRPIDARREGDALVSAWGTPDTEMGETTYRLVGDTRLEVTDRVRERDGSWRTFGQSVLMKR